jgi:hypothetical protein
MKNQADQTSFWFIPRYVLHPSKCSNQLHRALITSNILFAGPLLISDADLIHDQRIRRNLHGSRDFFRDLFENGLLKVAVRREADGTQDIARTAASLIAPGTAVPEVDQGLYLNATDLTLLLKDGRKIAIHYELEKAKDRYKRETLKLFRRLQKTSWTFSWRHPQGCRRTQQPEPSLVVVFCTWRAIEPEFK